MANSRFQSGQRILGFIEIQGICRGFKYFCDYYRWVWQIQGAPHANQLILFYHAG